MTIPVVVPSLAPHKFPVLQGNCMSDIWQKWLNKVQIKLSTAQTYAYIEVTADYLIQPADYIIGVNSPAAPQTTSLPTNVPGNVTSWVIKDEAGTAATHNITVSGNGHNIDGAATATISTNYGSLTIYSNGTQYYIGV